MEESIKKPTESGETTPVVAKKIEPSAFFKFSYGLFVLSSKNAKQDGGCIVNTGIQLTDNPKRIIVAVNKGNFTSELIAESGVLNLSVLTEDAPFALFQHYGFQSGRTVDKLSDSAAGVPKTAPNGVKYLSEYTNAVISGKVIQAQDYGTHTLFVADVTEAVTLSGAKSMTYAYYFENVKPKPAVQNDALKKKSWVCKICGYVHESEVLPPDFICPLCKHGADVFEESGMSPVNQSGNKLSANITNNFLGGLSMKKYVCTICGYVHEGNEPPEKCPLCNAPADKFTEQSGSMVFADEHRIGVAQGVDADIIEGLRANFAGECTEVGMYLAMSRQADREGYPEIAEAYKRYAFEEAEHAAKFAELLGEVVYADTKKNLQLRFEAEHGATDGKMKLAKRAKELNLDAIHDTVHEMAKDEARHGKGFQGLLSRYFGG